MAGPYTGSWRSSLVDRIDYTGAAKQGTGVNRVHATPATGSRVIVGGPPKQVFDPVTAPGGDDTYGYVAEDQGWSFVSDNPDPNLPQYDQTPIQIFGYGHETGTADRPRWDRTQGDRSSGEMGWGLPNPDTSNTVLANNRGSTQNDTDNNFPQWYDGSHPTQPGGTVIRAIRRGAKMIQKARVLPNEDVAQGWQNKAHGKAADSRSSDDSQIFVQTSDVQRYKTRSGSQRSASQSTFTAPVESRVTGQKLKTYTASDSARHWDMLPYEQQDFVRPFLSRQAGTGYPQWQLVNEMYVSPAIQREPPADPQLGNVAGVTGVSDGTDTNYGYTSEDLYY